MLPIFRRFQRIIALSLLLLLATQILVPLSALAVSGGPTQTESQGFQQVNATDMVDPFTGDFSYNLPLLDVGGYPINLAYHAGVGMEDEASWVGLGWNLNVGAITRNMRGLPDDFNGDHIKKMVHSKPNVTFGLNAGISGELFGLNFFQGSVKQGIFYNNYKGLGIENAVSLGINLSTPTKGMKTNGLGASASLSLAVSDNTQSGVSIHPSLSFGVNFNEIDKNRKYSYEQSYGFSMNSNAGLVGRTYGRSFSITEGYQHKGKNKLASLFGAGSSVSSYANPTFVPQISMPFRNQSISLNATIGADAFGAHPNLLFTAYGSVQELRQEEFSTPAFGYLNAHNHTQKGNVAPNNFDIFAAGETRPGDDALLDFNREKDGPFTMDVKNLPLTNVTHDLFSISGQGISGMFRAFRNDVGYVFDPRAEDVNNSFDLGGEFGGGNLIHAGANITTSNTTTKTGIWRAADGCNALSKFAYAISKPYDVSTNSNGNPIYEPYYFKLIGEQTSKSDSYNNYYQAIGGADPVYAPVLPYTNQGVNTITSVSANLKKADGSVVTPQSPYKRNVGIAEREKRTQLISSLSAEQAIRYGYNPKIKNYPILSTVNPATPQPVTELRTDAARKNHHLGEITVTRTDGMRYVYGIPAYNKSQKDVSFRVDPNINARSTGLANYTSGTSDSRNNSAGKDDYFSSTEIPAYAHSYLLTQMLSQDYVDLTGDGPTPDDHGSYFLFNYSKVDDNYGWRIPFEVGQASYSEGLRAKNDDDMAHYIYGQKEIWYLHSIVSKTRVAEFYISSREDGFGANGTQGGIDQTSPSYKLDKIKLYAYQDWLNKATSFPLTTVHFKYDYSLCQGTVNSKSNVGKLTLKEVRMTYGRSNNGSLSPYKFEYSSVNPNYSSQKFDRWGNYRDLVGANSLITSSDFSYAEQNESKANAEASAWLLKKITLPSKGTIDITYEADDYAYVQDKPAMQMFKVIGLANDDVISNAVQNHQVTFNNLTNQLYFGDNANLWVVIKTDAGVNSKEEFEQRYIKDIKNGYLYFKFLLDLLKKGDQFADYVPGYTQIADWAVINQNYAAIKLKPLDMDSGEPVDNVTDDAEVCHPIARAGWQMIVKEMSDIVNDEGVWNEIDAFVFGILAAIPKIFEGFGNTFNTYRTKFFASKAIVSENNNNSGCWIRLYQPTGRKFGGGSRVKQLAVHDNWKEFHSDNAPTASYGQVFDYTTIEKGEIISSGVASYEPLSGNEENPWRQPIPYFTKRAMFPDNTAYFEAPFGESFFPSPSVGYRKITIRSLHKDQINQPLARGAEMAPRATGTGKIIHEFYTAKDFPTIVKETKLDQSRYQVTPDPFDLFSMESIDYLAASQGYSVELNDMHGKPRSVKYFAESKIQHDLTTNTDKIVEGELVSGSEYFYRQKPVNPNEKTNSGPFQLDNSAMVVNADGTLSLKIIGEDIDFVADSRQQETTSETYPVQINLESFLAFIAPITIPILFPSFSSEYTRFQSLVTTKVVNRFGLIEKVVAFQDGASIATLNLAYDGNTGQPLLTKTETERADHVFGFSYPSHWAYDRMGPAYLNQGITYINVPIGANGQIAEQNVNAYLVSGDEVMTDFGKYWVQKLDNGKAVLLDQSGKIFSITNGSNSTIETSLTVIRSGNRNLLNTAIGSVQSLKLPLQNPWNLTSNRIVVDNSKQVIDAGSQNFRDKWQIFCCGLDDYEVQCDASAHKQTLQDALAYFFNDVNLISSAHTYELNANNPNLPNVVRLFFNDLITQANAVGSCPVSTVPLTGKVKFVLEGAQLNAFFEVYSKNCLVTSCKVVLTPQQGQDMSVLAEGSVMIEPPSEASRIQGDEAKFTLIVTNSQSKQFRFDGYTTCLPIFNCRIERSNSPNFCGILPGTVVNPYYQGILGNWRAGASLGFYGEREQVFPDNNLLVNAQTGGILKDFIPYWVYDAQSKKWKPNSAAPNFNNRWYALERTTKISPWGQPLETRDTLGRLKGMLYGYNFTLPTAQAVNAGYNEIFFDHFEDYSYYQNNVNDGCMTPPHFNFSWGLPNDNKVRVSDENAHTGLFSLRLSPAQQHMAVREDVSQCNVPRGQTVAGQYVVRQEDCIGLFQPKGERTYVLTGWVSEKIKTCTDNSGNSCVDVLEVSNDTTFANAMVSLGVYFNNGAQLQNAVYTIRGEGPIIDNWQRFYFEFTIPENAQILSVQLINNSTPSIVNNVRTEIYTYFDDLRLAPKNSGITTSVYDPRTLLKMSELDDNNFAVFMEYDERQNVVRTKQETARGIMTVQESRKNLSKPTN